MTFPKSTIPLATMAQWVDNNYDEPDVDRDVLLEYLYHLVYSNAYALKMFNDLDTYDDFSLFCVSKLLTRLSNKTAQPVKSIVNYIKTVLSPWQSEYIRLFCVGSADFEQMDFNVDDFSDYLIDVTSEFDSSILCFGCIRVTDAITRYLSKIPRKRHSPEWSNIVLSCVLTLYDRIKSAVALTKEHEIEDDPKLLSRIIRSMKSRGPILYHISEEQASYISVLVNELTHVISSEISYSTASKVTPQTCLRNLVTAASSEEE